MTLTIQIGNGDDKLKQREWSKFIGAINRSLHASAAEIHFFGTSHGDVPWQNACWVVEINDPQREALLRELTTIRQQYRQDAVAVTSGVTQFV